MHVTCTSLHDTRDSRHLYSCDQNAIIFQAVPLLNDVPADASARDTSGEHGGRGGPSVADHQDVPNDRRVLRRQRRREGVHENVEHPRPGSNPIRPLNDLVFL